MRRKPLPLLTRVLLLPFAAGWFGAGLSAAAQDSPPTNWVQQIYYDPPNSSRLKLELTGSQIISSNMLIKEFVIKQFSISNDSAELVAEAPECFWNRKNHNVNSAGPLQVRAQGGNFKVTGTGFLLDYDESILTISNQVHSLLQTGSGTNNTNIPLTEIFSRSARFESKSNSFNNELTYQGGVRAIDSKMKVSAEFLTVASPRGGADPTNHVTITAKTNVMIDFVSDNGDPIHATCEQAVYTSDSRDGTTNRIVELTGSPRIELTNGWMTADRFVFDQTTGKLRGSGSFHFHYLDGVSAKPTIASAATDLFSAQFEMDMATRIAEFWGGVKADRAGMQLNSEWLTATLPKTEAGTNRLEHLLARTNVVINFAGANERRIHATSQQAAYDSKTQGAATNEVLELTGNPTVETSGTNRAAWMTADVINVDRAQGRIWGAGNHHSVFKKNVAEPAAMDTEVYSESFDYANETGLAVYHENVRIYDPAMNATAAKTLTIKLAQPEPGRTNQIDSFRADGGVVIDELEKAFYPDDITNLTAFAARLKQTADPVAQFVTTNLSAETRQLLASYSSGTNVQLQQALVMDLNLLAQRGALYDPTRFAKVALSPRTTSLLQKHPLGVDLAELNRSLLLDAFRGALRRNQKGEITHATGDTATYDYRTGQSNHEVLVLSGHPRVEQPTRFLSADDAIVYDRTTQTYRGVGNFRGHTILEDVKSLPAKPKK